MSKVFLLADDARLRGDVEAQLSRSGYAVASDSLAAFRMSRVERFGPDVVILDTADEATAAMVRIQLFRHPVLADIPVIAIAASAEEAKSFGAQGFLPRLLQPEDVTHVISNI